MKKAEKTRTYYSPEFKADAVSLVERVGVTQASKDLGVDKSNLGRWKRESKKSADPRRTSGSDDAPSYKDLEKENRKLRKEIGYLEQINKVLKKSTAIFSRDQMDGFK